MDIHRPTILVHDRSQVTDGEQLGICHVDESYRATLVDTLLAVEWARPSYHAKVSIVRFSLNTRPIHAQAFIQTVSMALVASGFSGSAR